MSGFAWVTLATNDSYSLGALVLAHSLRHAGTAHQLAVLVTPGVSAPMREQLECVFDSIQEVNVLDSNDDANLALLARPELGITFTKLHCWTLTQYTKCVFLDADTLVLQPCDELFDREEFSAAPDVGWPDCFNSGVFVYRPSMETFKRILDLALTRGSFDGGDQGLLNVFFSDWATQDASRRLPFIYNMCSMATYSYLPAFKQFGSEAKIVHFIGPWKPWLLELDTQTGLVTPMTDNQHLLPLLQQWWSIFLSEVLPKLQPNMGGMAGALAQLQVGNPRSEQQQALEQHWRRQAWEHGHIDYLGRDSFDKIWAKILETLASTHIDGRSQPEPAAQVSTQPEVVGPVPAQPEEAAQPVDTAQPGESAEPTPTPVEPSQVEQVTTAVPLISASPVTDSLPGPAEQLVPSPPRKVSSSPPLCPPILPSTQSADVQLSPPKSPPVLPSSPPTTPPILPSPPKSPPVLTTLPKTPPIIPSSPETPPTLTSPPKTPPILPSSPPKTPPVVPSPPITPPTLTSPPKTPPVLTSPPKTPPVPTSPPKTPPVLTSPPKTPPVLTSPPKTPPVAISPPKTPPVLTSPPKTPPVLTSPPKTPPVLTSPPKTPPVLTSPPKTPPVPTSPPKTPPVLTSPPKTPLVPTSPPKTPPILPSTPPKSPVLKAPTAGPEPTRPPVVGSVTPPGTPPIVLGPNQGPNQQAQASQSEAEPAPIPPKRRGGPKGGKTAGQKGKK